MTKDHCPLGDDCDLLISYKHGVSSAKDIIVGLEAERDKLKAEVDKAYREGWLDGYAKRPQRFPRAALQETEK